MTAASFITLLLGKSIDMIFVLIYCSIVCFLCLYKVSDGQAVDRTTYGNDFYIGIIRADQWTEENEDRIFISTLSTQSVNFTIETDVGWNSAGNVSVDEPATVLLPQRVLRSIHHVLTTLNDICSL